MLISYIITKSVSDFLKYWHQELICLFFKGQCPRKHYRIDVSHYVHSAAEWSRR